MSLFELLKRIFIEDDQEQQTQRSNRPPAKTKRYVVRQQGKEDRYRTNKYGEVFHE